MSWDVVQAYHEGRRAARAGKTLSAADNVIGQAGHLGWLAQKAGNGVRHSAEIATCLHWFLDRHPASPALLAFSRKGLRLLEDTDRTTLLDRWRARAADEILPARALIIAAHFLESEDWSAAAALLSRAARLPQETLLLGAAAAALYETPHSSRAPGAEERLDLLAACRHSADRVHLPALGLISARMALAQQRWEDAERWAEETRDAVTGAAPAGIAETIAVAALARGNMDKARAAFAQAATGQGANAWNLRRVLLTTGLLHNAAWRNALLARLEHLPQDGPAASIQRTLHSWKQRVETGTTPPRL